eukprot:jgi/Psemu1/9546/gm1.9546_g
MFAGGAKDAFAHSLAPGVPTYVSINDTYADWATLNLDAFWKNISTVFSNLPNLTSKQQHTTNESIKQHLKTRKSSSSDKLRTSSSHMLPHLNISDLQHPTMALTFVKHRHTLKSPVMTTLIALSTPMDGLTHQTLNSKVTLHHHSLTKPFIISVLTLAPLKAPMSTFTYKQPMDSPIVHYLLNFSTPTIPAQPSHALLMLLMATSANAVNPPRGSPFSLPTHIQIKNTDTNCP